MGKQNGKSKYTNATITVSVYLDIINYCVNFYRISICLVISSLALILLMR